MESTIMGYMDFRFWIQGLGTSRFYGSRVYKGLRGGFAVFCGSRNSS